MPTGCSLAGVLMHALLDEGLGVGHDFRSIGPLSQVAVSIECASRSPGHPNQATSTSRRQRALHRPAARPRRWSSPAGRSPGSGTVSADALLVHELLGERAMARHAPVVVPDHVRARRPLRPPESSPRASAAFIARGFSQATHLPVASGLDGDLLACVTFGLPMSTKSTSSRATTLLPVGLHRLVAPDVLRRSRALSSLRAHRHLRTGSCSSSGKKWLTLR